jgi:hypothetical protein
VRLSILDRRLPIANIWGAQAASLHNGAFISVPRGMRPYRAAEHSIHQKIVGRPRRLPNRIGNREQLPYKLSDQKKCRIA